MKGVKYQEPHRDRYDRRSYEERQAEYVEHMRRRSRSYYGTRAGTRRKKR